MRLRGLTIMAVVLAVIFTGALGANRASATDAADEEIFEAPALDPESENPVDFGIRWRETAEDSWQMIRGSDVTVVPDGFSDGYGVLQGSATVIDGELTVLPVANTTYPTMSSTLFTEVLPDAVTELDAAVDNDVTLAAPVATMPSPIPDGTVVVTVDDDSTGCGSFPGLLGCGEPAYTGDTLVAALVTIYPDNFSLVDWEQHTTVIHEFGHAMNLAHFNGEFGGRLQTMHQNESDAVMQTYGTGDINGFAAMTESATAPPADSSIRLAASGPSSGAAGAKVTYSVDLTNEGDAGGAARMDVTVDSGFADATIGSGSGWACDFTDADDGWTCRDDYFEVGRTDSFAIEADLAGSGTARITMAIVDPDTGAVEESTTIETTITTTEVPPANANTTDTTAETLPFTGSGHTQTIVALGVALLLFGTVLISTRFGLPEWALASPPSVRGRHRPDGDIIATRPSSPGREGHRRRRCSRDQPSRPRSA